MLVIFTVRRLPPKRPEKLQSPDVSVIVFVTPPVPDAVIVPAPATEPYVRGEPEPPVTVKITPVAVIVKPPPLATLTAPTVEETSTVTVIPKGIYAESPATGAVPPHVAPADQLPVKAAVRTVAIAVKDNSTPSTDTISILLNDLDNM